MYLRMGRVFQQGEMRRELVGVLHNSPAWGGLVS